MPQINILGNHNTKKNGKWRIFLYDFVFVVGVWRGVLELYHCLNFRCLVYMYQVLRSELLFVKIQGSLLLICYALRRLLESSESSNSSLTAIQVCTKFELVSACFQGCT